MNRRFLPVLLVFFVAQASSAQPRFPPVLRYFPRSIPQPPQPTPPPSPSLCNVEALTDAADLVLGEENPVETPTPSPAPCMETLTICQSARRVIRLEAELQIETVRLSRLRDLRLHSSRCRY